MIGDDKVTADNWAGGVQFPRQLAKADELNAEDPSSPYAQSVLKEVRVDQPLPMAPVTIQPAQDAYESVLQEGGAYLPRRDSVDLRILGEVQSGQVTYKDGIITDISQVGGYPQYNGDPLNVYSDNDGIPDWWKIKYGLKLHDPTLANQDLTGDGYTAIEKYLDGLDPTKKIDWTDPASNVNTLSRAKLFNE